MKFMKGCKLSYAMLKAPTIYCEVVKEIWTSAIYNSGNNSFFFTLKRYSYACDTAMLANCLHLPTNNCEKCHEPKDIFETLNMIDYNGDMSNLSKIVRKCLRREWSYFYDIVIKIFSGKLATLMLLQNPCIIYFICYYMIDTSI